MFSAVLEKTSAAVKLADNKTRHSLVPWYSLNSPAQQHDCAMGSDALFFKWLWLVDCAGICAHVCGQLCIHSNDCSTYSYRLFHPKRSSAIKKHTTSPAYDIDHRVFKKHTWSYPLACRHHHAIHARPRLIKHIVWLNGYELPGQIPLRMCHHAQAAYLQCHQPYAWKITSTAITTTRSISR